MLIGQFESDEQVLLREAKNFFFISMQKYNNNY